MARARPGKPGCRLCGGTGVAAYRAGDDVLALGLAVGHDEVAMLECPECFPPPLVSIGTAGACLRCNGEGFIVVTSQEDMIAVANGEAVPERGAWCPFCDGARTEIALTPDLSAALDAIREARRAGEA